MIPFKIVTHYNIALQKETNVFQPGFIPLSAKEIKYDYDGNGPLKLVYASPSFTDDTIRSMTGVFVYEVNKNYIPINNP
jgi:dolichyl-diphosphooligosaccharide--protein glycosyltransferase